MRMNALGSPKLIARHHTYHFPSTRSPDDRLTELYVSACRRFIPMDEPLFDLETVTLKLEDETIEAIDEKAYTDHRGNREAAIRDLLDEWLKTRKQYRQ